MSETIDCKNCRGVRPVMHGCCQGCATPVDKAKAPPAYKEPPWQCPLCGHRKFVHLGHGGRSCQGCFKVFEQVEYGFACADPERNASSREEFQQRQAERAAGKKVGSTAAANRFRRL